MRRLGACSERPFGRRAGSSLGQNGEIGNQMRANGPVAVLSIGQPKQAKTSESAAWSQKIGTGRSHLRGQPPVDGYCSSVYVAGLR